ncbi:Ppp2r2a protein [Salpingoeca rosetta]|uniref:Serine/threonine-protein phosphatase 2A 55 kDa regulatory subunit B n=1 Tax=Salpingoeca rosetta (strain ATCC 50818 / BSB-021) TaxID=946362 RepID=F2URF0_SALR5|nr:Ppp2r2a protein [Salpingoeca rosetta]EGD80253.1 Ppp2r2a protein [Salpingoeca rosetta]|eukprot:XP_004988315.1 Ppp2r2a protein [Salpingoeca rosetta]
MAARVDGLPEPLVWNFSQVFGDRVEEDDEIADADIISAVQFSHSGEYLATGDRGGRVVLFERNQSDVGSPAEYRFYTEFQSHEAEFDYLKSMEIEEKINQIQWLKRCNHAHFLLTTNDKTVKLWKVRERAVRVETEHAPAQIGKAAPEIRVPQLLTTQEVEIDARAKRIYANAHTYHINSISVNSDEETFLSADDLRINLWNLSITDQSFNIVDMKPENMDDLTEVITCAEFHPQECNVFIYGSSRGIIKMADMRQAALCDSHAKQFEITVDEANKGFFSEILSSIADVKFSPDGKYIMSRDYLTLKIWDVAMESRPVQEFSLHDFLKPKLCDLYENDCIFDKFEAVWSGDGRSVMGGSYSNLFHVFERESGQDVLLQASRDAIEGPTHVLSPITVLTGAEQPRSRYDLHADQINLNQKIMHADWHPNRNIMALAAVNNLYLFRQ